NLKFSKNTNTFYHNFYKTMNQNFSISKRKVKSRSYSVMFFLLVCGLLVFFKFLLRLFLYNGLVFFG
ncbi:hypothetical protein EWZ77_06895, partial [Helicobacter pylori]|nr:hypothetical protein [Helicobacter pylori]